ncbi:MAG: hypothetical protein U0841_13025 [Chloroflexia bacterium]
MAGAVAPAGGAGRAGAAAQADTVRGWLAAYRDGGLAALVRASAGRVFPPQQGGAAGDGAPAA